MGPTYVSVQSVSDAGLAVRQASSPSGLAGAPAREIWSDTGNLGEVWAPELHYEDGRYLVYFTAGRGSAHRMYLVTSATADSDYGAPVEVSLRDDRWAIDGSMFTDDGQRWFVWSGWEGTTNVASSSSSRSWARRPDDTHHRGGRRRPRRRGRAAGPHSGIRRTAGRRELTTWPDGAVSRTRGRLRRSSMGTDPPRLDREGALVKYVILIHSNPQPWGHPTSDFLEEYQALPAPVRERLQTEFDAMFEQMEQRGEFISAEPLGDPRTSRLFRWSDDDRLVTDGPYAEGKEHLAGFFLIDVDSQQRAEEIARHFGGPGDVIELRPVMDGGSAES
ncbi:MAG: family 43 glycosylhydrolase [Phycicoccus sp.]